MDTIQHKEVITSGLNLVTMDITNLQLVGDS